MAVKANTLVPWPPWQLPACNPACVNLSHPGVLMGIVSFSHSPMLSVLLAPVHALVAMFAPVQGIAGANRLVPPAGARCASHQLALPFVTGDAAAHRPSARLVSSKAGRLSPTKSHVSRLKVVREFDSNVSPACAGRMVISGRMADVCAELERMAQREAAQR